MSVTAVTKGGICDKSGMCRICDKSETTSGMGDCCKTWQSPFPSHPLSSLLSSPLLGCDDDGGGGVIDDHRDGDDIDIGNCDDIL